MTIDLLHANIHHPACVNMYGKSQVKEKGHSYS